MIKICCLQKGKKKSTLLIEKKIPSFGSTIMFSQLICSLYTEVLKGRKRCTNKRFQQKDKSNNILFQKRRRSEEEEEEKSKTTY